MPRTADRYSGRPAIVHGFVVAAVSTSIFMLCTFSELGPFGPLVIAEAFYLLIFAAALEAVFVAMVAWDFARTAASRRRTGNSSASSSREGVLG